MSLATRCTACGTIFRVVQDQLRVSEGWVRCGRCAEVFDAREQLFDIDREAPPPWPVGSSGATATTAATADPLAATPPRAEDEDAEAAAAAAPPPSESTLPAADIEFDISHGASGGSERWPQVDAAAPPAQTALAAPREPSDAEIEDQLAQIYAEAIAAAPNPQADDRHEPRWIDDEEAPSATAPLASPVEAAGPFTPKPAHAPADTTSSTIAEVEAGTAAADLGLDVVLAPGLAGASAGAAASSTAAAALPSFMRQAERARRWRSPGVRAAMGAGVLLLALLLALQIAHHFRNAIAALYPQARPALQSLCEFSGCQLQAWKRIDALSVESSALSQASGGSNRYQLAISLRNKSAVEVATPWVELSLTDAAGSTIARRMLPPGEFRNGKPAIAAGAELALQLQLSTGSQKVSGYTVEIFHP